MSDTVDEVLPISLVVITLNEEKNIKRCLDSARFCADVLVVDSNSQDKTVEIAKANGARTLTKEWLGFGPQKAFAVANARQDWILSLDADEALSVDLQKEIVSLFKNQKLDPEFGYALKRQSFHLGRWILHGGWYPDPQLRLFNRQYSQWSTSDIHEKVNAKKVIRLQHPLLHWVFESLSDQVVTNDRYSTIQSKQILHADIHVFFIISKLLVKPPVKFFECYVFKRGFMDGLPGFIIAVSAAYSVFLKWSKVIEREKKWQNTAH